MSSQELLVTVAGSVIGFLGVWLLMGARRRDAAPPPAIPRPPAALPLAAEPPWYDVLGVDEHATIAEIKEAYRRAVSAYHPDKVASLGPELIAVAERKTKSILQAYRQAQTLRRFNE